MSHETLKEIFARYAGKQILNPNRMTRDLDVVTCDLAEEVAAAGFVFGPMQEKGAADEGCRVPPNFVGAEYERGADRKWRLTGKFKLGNRMI